MTMHPREAVERAVELSQADDCIAIGFESTTANVRWANNTSTTNGVSHSTEVFVISIRDGRVGSLGRSYVDSDRLVELLRDSEAACEGKPPAEDRMPLVTGNGAGDWNEPHPETGIDVFSGFAPDLGRAFDAGRRDGIELFGYAEHTTSTVWLATSSGIFRRFTQPEGLVELTGKTPDFKRSSWAGRGTTTFTDVDVDAMYAKLTERLGWSKEVMTLDPGRYEVLLEPSCAADMLIYAYWAASARDADEGRSVYSKPGGGNRVGERMFPDTIDLYSDPGEPDLEVTPFQATPASSSYASVFDNGLDVGRTEWIRDGVLQNLITTRHWAEKTGSGDAVPFVGNLIMPSDGPALEDMIASTERGLLVTCLWYIRTVDPRTLLLTGLTRDGVFLVEGGKVVGAVNNFRFNMSPIDMLARVTQASATEPTLAREFGDYFRFTKVPALRVEDFNMSSVSEAT